MILHSTDGGSTWTRQGTPQSLPDVGFESVAAVDANNCWVVGNPANGYGTIFHTVDGGNTWVRQGSPDIIPDAGLGKISAVDVNTAWVVGTSGTVLYTDDGGNHWVQKNTPNIPSVLLQGVFAIDADNVWITGAPDSGYGTIFRTADGGATWERKGSAAVVPDTTLLDVHAVDQNSTWVAAAGNHDTPQASLIHTSDNGQSWQGYTLGSGWFDANNVTTVGPNTVWAVTDADGIYRKDNGHEFARQPAAHGAYDYYLLCIDALDSQTAWASGSAGDGYGILENTHDGGQTWEAQIETNVGLRGVSFVKLFTVTASVAGGHGTVTPSSQNVVRNGSATINIKPDDGYNTASVDDSGTEITPTPTDQYTINNVTADHEVHVTFTSDSSTWYLAEGTNAWGFNTYLTVENPQDEQLTARLTYMDPNQASGAGVAGTRVVTLPPLSQTTISSISDIGNIDFSTKVECLQGKAIAVDRTMFWTGPGRSPEQSGYHSSIGATSPSKTWYLPEGSSAWGFETWTLVENPNPTQASVALTYMTEGGPRHVSKTVPAHSRASYNMQADIGAADSSIQVSSNVPVVVERSTYKDNRREGSCSIGATTPSSHYFLAEGAIGYNVGFVTYVLVQNPNNTTNDVTLTYQTASGEVAGPTFTMQPDTRKTVSVNDTLPANTNVSTTVHGSKPLVAERAMYWDNGTGQAFHASIGLDSPHMTFMLPDGQTSNGFETWTLVQNPNQGAVTVRITYLPQGGGTLVSFTTEIPRESRATFKMADKIPPGRASILVESLDRTRPVIVERATYVNNQGAGTDTIGGFSD